MTQDSNLDNVSSTDLENSMASSSELWNEVMQRLNEVQEGHSKLAKAVDELGAIVSNALMTEPAHGEAPRQEPTGGSSSSILEQGQQGFSSLGDVIKRDPSSLPEPPHLAPTTEVGADIAALTGSAADTERPWLAETAEAPSPAETGFETPTNREAPWIGTPPESSRHGSSVSKGLDDVLSRSAGLSEPAVASAQIPPAATISVEHGGSASGMRVLAPDRVIDMSPAVVDALLAAEFGEAAARLVDPETLTLDALLGEEFVTTTATEPDVPVESAPIPTTVATEEDPTAASTQLESQPAQETVSESESADAAARLPDAPTSPPAPSARLKARTQPLLANPYPQPARRLLPPPPNPEIASAPSPPNGPPPSTSKERIWSLPLQSPPRGPGSQSEAKQGLDLPQLSFEAPEKTVDSGLPMEAPPIPAAPANEAADAADTGTASGSSTTTDLPPLSFEGTSPSETWTLPNEPPPIPPVTASEEDYEAPAVGSLPPLALGAIVSTPESVEETTLREWAPPVPPRSGSHELLPADAQSMASEVLSAAPDVAEVVPQGAEAEQAEEERDANVVSKDFTILSKKHKRFRIR